MRFRVVRPSDGDRGDPAQASSRLAPNGARLAWVALFALTTGTPGLTQPRAATVHATIDAAKTHAAISPSVYGQFIEHIGGIINRGLWAEMLDDRKFYHEVAPPEAPPPAAEDRRALTIAVLNPTESEQPLELTVTGADLAAEGRLWRMAPSRLDATITPGQKPEVEVEERTVAGPPASGRYPPFSVSLYVVPVREGTGGSATASSRSLPRAGSTGARRHR